MIAERIKAVLCALIDDIDSGVVFYGAHVYNRAPPSLQLLSLEVDVTTSRVLRTGR